MSRASRRAGREARLIAEALQYKHWRAHSKKIARGCKRFCGKTLTLNWWQPLAQLWNEGRWQAQRLLQSDGLQDHIWWGVSNQHIWEIGHFLVAMGAIPIDSTMPSMAQHMFGATRASVHNCKIPLILWGVAIVNQQNLKNYNQANLLSEEQSARKIENKWRINTSIKLFLDEHEMTQATDVLFNFIESDGLTEVNHASLLKYRRWII